jgi:hypothetical protein
MRQKFILIAAGALLGIGVLGWAAGQALDYLTARYITKKEKRLFYLPAFALTTDQTPIEFELRDRMLRVPKAYLNSSTNGTAAEGTRFSSKPCFPTWSRQRIATWRSSQSPAGTEKSAS